MKKDIPERTAKNIKLAVIRKPDEADGFFWEVHLINRNKFDLDNAIIASKGYGEKDGEQQETSVLRHYFEKVSAKESILIEPIDSSVFHLFNEYWVSYYIDKEIYDKRFVFVPDTLLEDNLIMIPELQLEGVLHS